MSAMNALLFLVIVLGLFSSSLPSNRRFRIPKIYGNAIPLHQLDPLNNGTQKKIVLYHNFFRSKVDPPASNMLEMSYSDEAAEDAQRWAEECQLLVHDNVTGRWVSDYGSCGQNIFVANVQVPWHFAVNTWFLEKDNFTYDSDTNDPGIVGHYTQLVWYSSHEVGCGFHYCSHGSSIGNSSRPFYNYVCNYCPIGNFPERFDRPYDQGPPCSDCSGYCKYKKLCTNSCPYADLWANCNELNATWHNWLCEGDQQGQCRASCFCAQNKII